MKHTQEEKIISLLRLQDDWLPSWALIKVNTPLGWLGSGADRCARDMAEHNLIERKREGKYAYYRLIQGQQKLW